ncbi:hypothetical protein SAMN05192589_101225 [Paracidovorax valerianellae]|uniref:Uncharacterized protein n=1 Tax=Paracidovorax valerianellae TaxID=187868 RepID=A0A1G6IQB5_9BURK|nr:hypothetical protein [Paracidovorax valerianellae]SDC08674.1 hypothetical protein SAMN05192589_101225 [Paracidovorax valerianellae]
MRRINGGQSALIHMEPAPARVWLVQCPPGMLANGHSIKRFSNVQAFEGYVRQVRDMGMTVRFDSPFAAVVEASA